MSIETILSIELPTIMAFPISGIYAVRSSFFFCTFLAVLVDLGPRRTLVQYENFTDSTFHGSEFIYYINSVTLIQ